MSIANLQQVNAVLSHIARGYKFQNMVGTEVCPVVYHDVEQGQVPVFPDEMFQLGNTVRALRAATNEIIPEALTNVTYAMAEHDAAFPMDYREINASARIHRRQKYGARVALSRIMLRLEYEIATLVTTASSYASAHKTTLSGSTQWSHASSTPIADIETARQTIMSAIGQVPNVLLLGKPAFKALKTNAQVLSILKTTADKVVTPQLLAQIFEVEKVVVGTAVQKTNAAVASDIWGDFALLTYSPQPSSAGAMLDESEPAFGYTLRYDGYPLVDEYSSADQKTKFVRVTDMFKPIILGANAGYLWSDCVA